MRKEDSTTATKWREDITTRQQNSPTIEETRGHIGPEPDVNWLSRLRGILLVAVNKWVNKWIIPQSEQELFNRLLSKLIKYQVEIGSRPN